MTIIYGSWRFVGLGLLLEPTHVPATQVTGRFVSHVPRGKEDRMAEDWDRVWKQTTRAMPVAVLNVLCQVDAAEDDITPLPTELHRSLRVDCAFAVRHADGERPLIVNIEVQSTFKEDFELRLLRYWVALHEEHKVPPLQVVVLPREVTHRYSGTYVSQNVTFRYKVVNVADLDPQELLKTDLAPLALQASDTPEDFVDAVLDRIQEADVTYDVRLTMVELAILGGGETLKQLVADAMGRRDMTQLMKDTSIGRAIAAEADARGRAEGRAEAIRAYLVRKFGEHDDIDLVAAHLAAHDLGEAYAKIDAAGSFDDLRS